MPGASVSIVGATKTFDRDFTPLLNISLDVAPGEFIAFLGPSGCGKTTLLRLIAGLDQPTLGTISARAERDLRVSYVFQDAHLLPWRNLTRNVELPLELIGVPKDRWAERVGAALRNVKLESFGSYMPWQLSGGMKMRASLARALVRVPNLLLLDEPFAALDEVTRIRLDEDLRQIWREEGMTIFFVTHSISEAAFLANRVVVFSRRERGIVADLSIELPEERNAELRQSPKYQQIVRQLYELFQDHGGET